MNIFIFLYLIIYRITGSEFLSALIFLSSTRIYETDDLTLDYPTITQVQLNALLNVLYSVKYTLTIKNITSSVSITSSILTTAGKLYIINNPGLKSITGFKSLTNTSMIYIKNNPKLTTITGFTKLVKAPTIYIDKLSLASLKKMPNIMAKLKKPKYYVIKSKTQLTYRRIKGTTIKLIWNRHSYNPAIKLFKVYKAIRAGLPYKLIKTVTNTSLITTGVRGNSFKVLAVNANGSLSSNIITITK